MIPRPIPPAESGEVGGIRGSAIDSHFRVRAHLAHRGARESQLQFTTVYPKMFATYGGEFSQDSIFYYMLGVVLYSRVLISG